MPPPRNLPNLITGLRLILAGVLFVLLVVVDAARDAPDGSSLRHVASAESLWLNACLGIFATAVFTDALDGYVARRWALVTDFGRIVDPFADKVIVCGSYVLLIPLEESRVSAWLVVLILARELLVDGLRGFAEARGVAFPAMFSGKAKMFAQSGCVTWILFALANLRGASWAETVTAVFLGLVVVVTLLSAIQYVFHARRVLGSASLATHTAGGDDGGER